MFGLLDSTNLFFVVSFTADENVNSTNTSLLSWVNIDRVVSSCSLFSSFPTPWAFSSLSFSSSAGLACAQQSLPAAVTIYLVSVSGGGGVWPGLGAFLAPKWTGKGALSGHTAAVVTPSASFFAPFPLPSSSSE